MLALRHKRRMALRYELRRIGRDMQVSQLLVSWTQNQDDSMRFLAWNVGHQTRSKPLPASVGSALAKLSPDVVVLTKYVYHDSHRPFLDALKEHGLGAGWFRTTSCGRTRF